MARFETTFWTDDKIEQLRSIMAQHPSRRPSREKIAQQFGTTAIAIRRVCQRKGIHVATDEAEVFWTEDRSTRSASS